MRTAEAIWKACKHAKTAKSERVMMNRIFREQDDSWKWPISNKFNATERAIRAAQKFERESGCAMYGLEYALFIEEEISRIVNREV